MDRAPVVVPLQTGLKVVDALIPVGRGQRELILGDRQTGKTAIAIDTILNQRGQNVLCVYCAIGQRASAVAKVVANLRENGAMDYTVVVVAEGNDAPGLVYITPYAATSIAEYFMEKGRDVLTAASKSLVEYARGRLSRQLAVSGASPEVIDGSKHLFDPKRLTLGFARRFATYKRPNLLLQNPQRLLRLLTNSQCPVQLIIAGKAHPADGEGKALIHEWMHFIRLPEACPHVIFLSDYDMLLTEHLVQGVDVWINTPRRPWEACGTSGMKVLVNGGINLSELDGWWAEAYTPEVGWALGDGQEHGDDPAWDAVEAGALYDVLKREVIPEFYTRNQSGIPTAWVARKHGAVDTAFLRKPCGARIHRATLPSGCGRLPWPRSEQRRNRRSSGRLAACGRSEMGFVELRRLARRNQHGSPPV
ncbi:MAG: alpha-glucan family phosphorylase [Candidatus Sulfotelmatobacter sp.]|jgi:hypothetical protein